MQCRIGDGGGGDADRIGSPPMSTSLRYGLGTGELLGVVPCTCPISVPRQTGRVAGALLCVCGDNVIIIFGIQVNHMHVWPKGMSSGGELRQEMKF